MNVARLPTICLMLALNHALVIPACQAADKTDSDPWQAGVSVVVITPEQPMMLEGFGSRQRPAEGKATELYAKALALQDASGTRLVIVTCDLIGIPLPLRERVAGRLKQRFGLPPASLLLNASHTHCGPELKMTATALEGLSEPRQKLTTAYCTRLEGTLVELVGKALADLQPAQLSYSHARAGFAMNRRLKNPDPPGEPFLNHPNPDGPVDHSVPVLQVMWNDQDRRAVLFGYACHNTTLFVNQYAADYAGYAQSYLESDHPGTTALFLAGCGGDQNGYPRGTIELSRRHGRTLATAVEAAQQNRQTPIHGPLAVELELVKIEYQTPPTREQLAAYLADSPTSSFKSYELTKTHAQRLLHQLVHTGKLRTSYNYPVQTVRFGDRLVLVALAGEVVVDYSLRLKRELAGTAAVWVSGYNNDVFAYIPSRRLLAEGGYEPRRSMNYFTTTIQPGPFAPSIEDRLVGKVRELLARSRKKANR